MDVDALRTADEPDRVFLRMMIPHHAGALLMAVSGPYIQGRPLPMVVGMASGAFIALALTWLTLGGQRAQRLATS